MELTSKGSVYMPKIMVCSMYNYGKQVNINMIFDTYTCCFFGLISEKEKSFMCHPSTCLSSFILPHQSGAQHLRVQPGLPDGGERAVCVCQLLRVPHTSRRQLQQRQCGGLHRPVSVCQQVGGGLQKNCFFLIFKADKYNQNYKEKEEKEIMQFV